MLGLGAVNGLLVAGAVSRSRGDDAQRRAGRLMARTNRGWAGRAPGDAPRRGSEWPTARVPSALTGADERPTE